MPRLADFIQRQARHRLPQGGDIVHGLAGLGGAVFRFRHKAGHGATVAGDDYCVSLLHRVNQLGQMYLGIGDSVIWTSRMVTMILGRTVDDRARV